MDRETAKGIAKDYLGSYLESKGINIRKPFRCLSPDHIDKNPSMSYDRKRQRCKCFSCGVSYDIFDLVRMDYGLNEGAETFNKTYSLYGLTIDSNNSNTQPQPQKKEDPAEDYTAYYKRTQEGLRSEEGLNYIKARGISPEVAEAYGLGYDPSYNTFNTDAEGKRTGATWKALIIPTGKSSYIVRNAGKEEEPAKKNRYRKKGASLIFNSKALYDAASPIFITEGEIDALSIIEAGGQAIGLGSTSNYKQLVGLLEEKKAAQPFILALDNDTEGRETEEKLAEELERLGQPFYRYSLYGEYKDANEALIKGRQAFIEEIKAAEKAQEAELEALEAVKREEYLKTSAAYHIKDFLDGITASANTPAISTGFYSLDKILDGGLYEGLYILGAISSLGKTTLALQLADNLAQAGQDVLIFSLEMARSELMAKSISRLTYLAAEDKRDAKTTRGITAGARWKNYSEKEKQLINYAVRSYAEYAQRIFIHEGVGDIGIEEVKEIVKQHITTTGNKPVVIIDYLQILAPYDLRSTDKQNTDKAVLELKRLSRDNKITVLGISSFNRDSYKVGGSNKGRVSMTDFKESGAVEYSADVLLGLEFISAGSSDYNEQTEKRKDPREIKLVVLKNRNGKAWEDTTFSYFPLFNYYQESEGFIDVTETAGSFEDPFKELRRNKAK